MKQYSQFTFTSYTFSQEEKTLSLNYSLDNEVHFTETFTFDIPFTNTVDWPAVDRACRALWLMAGVSYFKATLPPEITFQNGGLVSDQEKEFFSTVYKNGLGEFFYTNNISPHGKINFPELVSRARRNEFMAWKKDQGRPDRPLADSQGSGYLIPMGGGKDSLTTTQLLQQADQNITTWTVGNFPFMKNITDVIGAPHLSVQRKISPELLRLNAQGALNGHVPITAILAFASVVTALLTGKKYIALSNESSANEANVHWEGMDINHQYSKTLACEKLIQEYISNHITTSVHYFSFLRPLSELHISEIFCRSAFQKYKSVFSSCNRNFHINQNRQSIHWCGECSKCAFIACIFAPFVSKEQHHALFQKNMFADQSLFQTYKDLTGLGEHKPFECVGEYQEIAHALTLARDSGQYPDLKNFPIPEVDIDYKKLSPHSMPPEVYAILKKNIS